MTTNTLIKNFKIPHGFLKNYSAKLFLGGIFLLVYLPALIWMWDRWFARDSYYSHGILIPFVTGYLIWQKRDELTLIKPEKSPLGMVIIVFGLVIHLLSSILRIYFSSGFSMIIVLLGLIAHFYGNQILKKVLFPILFLFFMVPLPMVVITNISFQMKLFAATLATGILNNMGLPAIQEGSILKMRHTYVIVDDVCSGLRSLISLTALGMLFAYWMKSGIFKKVILFLSTIPIAIITNVCRIVFLSFVSEIWGPEYAVGFIHDFSGFLVFALAFVLLFFIGKLLE